MLSAVGSVVGGDFLQHSVLSAVGSVVGDDFLQHSQPLGQLLVVISYSTVSRWVSCWW